MRLMTGCVDASFITVPVSEISSRCCHIKAIFTLDRFPDRLNKSNRRPFSWPGFYEAWSFSSRTPALFVACSLRSRSIQDQGRKSVLMPFILGLRDSGYPSGYILHSWNEEEIRLSLSESFFACTKIFRNFEPSWMKLKVPTKTHNQEKVPTLPRENCARYPLSKRNVELLMATQHKSIVLELLI